MAAAMLLFFPCLAVPFVIGILATYYCLALTKKEIDLGKRLVFHQACRYGYFCRISYYLGA